MQTLNIRRDAFDKILFRVLFASFIFVQEEGLPETVLSEFILFKFYDSYANTGGYISIFSTKGADISIGSLGINLVPLAVTSNRHFYLLFLMLIFIFLGCFLST